MDGYVQRVATLEGAKCYPVVIMDGGHSSRFLSRPFITSITSATVLDHVETRYFTHAFGISLEACQKLVATRACIISDVFKEDSVRS